MSTTLQGGQNPQPTQGRLLPAVTEEEYNAQRAAWYKAEGLIRKRYCGNVDSSYEGTVRVDARLVTRLAMELPHLGDISENIGEIIDELAEIVKAEAEGLEGGELFDINCEGL